MWLDLCDGNAYLVPSYLNGASVSGSAGRVDAAVPSTIDTAGGGEPLKLRASVSEEVAASPDEDSDGGGGGRSGGGGG